MPTPQSQLEDPSIYYKKVPRENLLRLKKKKQPTNTTTLNRLLSIHGFKLVKNNGGSHSTYKNETFPEIRVTIAKAHKGNDPTRPNINVAEACLHYRTKKERSITDELENTAQAKNTAINNDNLPDDIESLIINGTSILRHKQHPCIGHTIPKTLVSQQRDIYIMEIRQRAEKLSSYIEEAKKEGITIYKKQDDAELVFFSPENQKTLILPNFAGHNTAPLTQTENFILDNMDINTRNQPQLSIM